MNSREYWQKRFIQDKALGIKSSQEYELELNKRLDQLLNIYDEDIKKWYRRFSNNLDIPLDKTIKILDGIEFKHFDITLKEFKRKAIKGGYEKQLNSEYFKSQIAQLKQLESQLKARATNLFSVEQLKMQDELVSQYDDTYLHETYNIQDFRGQFIANFSKLNHEEVKQVIAKPWAKDGKDFSTRVWGNYVEELPNQLMDSILRSSLTGLSYSKVEREFRERFSDVKTNHIHRLVVSEIGHIQETASADVYKEQDVEKYEYVATFERSTCDDCAKLDHQVFYVKDRQPGTNYPLIHPYCRCTTIPYL